MLTPHNQQGGADNGGQAIREGISDGRLTLCMRASAVCYPLALQEQPHSVHGAFVRPSAIQLEAC